MPEDFELGKSLIALGNNLSLHDFVQAFEHRIDWDRFDWEGGETELHKTLLLVHAGYVQAGGILDITEVFRGEEVSHH